MLVGCKFRCRSPRTPQFPASKALSSVSPILRKKAERDSRSPQPHPPSSRHTLYPQLSPIPRSRKQIDQLRTEYSAVLETVRERERKQTLAKMLKDRFGVVLSRTKVELCSKEELVREAVWKWQVRVAQAAARKMRIWLYCRRVERVQTELRAREHISAFRIQRQWKRYKQLVIAARIHAQRRLTAAAAIQRVFRGYRSRLLTQKMRINAQIDRLSIYYRLIRSQMMKEAARKIYKAWKFWKARKKTAKNSSSRRQNSDVEMKSAAGDLFRPAFVKAQSVNLDDFLENPTQRSRARTVHFASPKPLFGKQSPVTALTSDLPPIPQEKE